ncbi:hypothetical protein BU23DRAFT_304883 [Bimuria novae-zelandiae CBS 107.79]|uniref:Uncharacterized protein n=1 Tax=Bimuria novae-zelandiae CBS 107.79 TaxID=1447943 RepID=A0A6A5UP95_9PLEO|nr:hypothetical protein BU23DRAFT_304883 [Bimuria novae-zelandiae CBS 107.79]
MSQLILTCTVPPDDVPIRKRVLRMRMRAYTVLSFTVQHQSRVFSERQSSCQYRACGEHCTRSARVRVHHNDTQSLTRSPRIQNRVSPPLRQNLASFWMINKFSTDSTLCASPNEQCLQLRSNRSVIATSTSACMHPEAPPSSALMRCCRATRSRSKDVEIEVPIPGRLPRSCAPDGYCVLSNVFQTTRNGWD